MPLDTEQRARLEQVKNRRRQNALAESLGHASQFNPSEQRRADILSTELEAPIDSVSNNMIDAERLKEAQTRVDPSILQNQSPGVAEWMSDPVRARVSMDDLDVMQRFERNLNKKDIPFWTNTARGIGERANTLTGNLIEFAGNVSTDFEDKMRSMGIPNPGIVFGEDGISWSWDVDTAESGSALNTIGHGISEGGLGYESNFSWENLKGDPTVANIAGYIVETGAQSVVDMGAIMATLPAYLASRTEEIAESRVANKGGGEVDTGELLEAMPTAVLVALSERYATKGILGAFADKGAKLTGRHVAKEIGKSTVREAGTEFVQEQIEYAGETLGTGVMWDYKQSLDRGFAGAVAGGPVGAVGRAITLPLDAANIKVQEEVVKGLNSISEQQSIDGIVDDIQNMKLFQESPDRAAEFLKGMSGDEKIYITPEEVAAASEEGLPVPQYMLDAAKEATDVEVSVDQLAMDVISSEELLARLRPHMKRSSEAYTQSEIDNRNTNQLDRLLTNAKEDVEVRTEAESIHDQVTEQLVATGRMSQETARHSASIIPAFVTTKVAELKARGVDVSVKEVFEKMNFRVDPKTTSSSEPTLTPQQVEAADKQALEAVEGTVILNQGTESPTKLYVDPETTTEATEGQLEPMYLTATPTQEGAQESAYVNITNPKILHGPSEDMTLAWNEDDLQALRDEGYDGVWYQHPDGDRVIALDPGQVKTVPALVLDQSTVPTIDAIQQEVSAYEQLLACTRAA